MFESIYNAIAKLSASWDKEKEEFSSKLTQISDNYAGTLLQEKELELRSAHQDKREQLIRRAKSRVDEAYQDIKKQINKKFAYTTSRDAVPDINVLKSLKLTQKDVDVMVEVQGKSFGFTYHLGGM